MTLVEVVGTAAVLGCVAFGLIVAAAYVLVAGRNQFARWRRRHP